MRLFGFSTNSVKTTKTFLPLAEASLLLDVAFPICSTTQKRAERKFPFGVSSKMTRPHRIDNGRKFALVEDASKFGFTFARPRFNLSRIKFVLGMPKIRPTPQKTLSLHYYRVADNKEIFPRLFVCAHNWFKRFK